MGVHSVFFPFSVIPRAGNEGVVRKAKGSLVTTIILPRFNDRVDYYNPGLKVKIDLFRDLLMGPNKG